MKQLRYLAATSTTVLALTTIGSTGATPILASGYTGTVNCTNVQSLNGVQCIGEINGNTLVIDIEGIGQLNTTQLAVLAQCLDQVLSKDQGIMPLEAQMNQIASDVVQQCVAGCLGIHACIQVKVVELGVVGSTIECT